MIIIIYNIIKILFQDLFLYNHKIKEIKILIQLFLLIIYLQNLNKNKIKKIIFYKIL